MGRVTPSGMTHEPGNGGSSEWYTPPWLFEHLGLNFDLDPCAPPAPAAPWIPADERISLPDDGLRIEWEGRVWLNPPYGDQTARWVKRLEEHGDGVALVFARVDTGWSQSALAAADAVCFVRGRVEFSPGPGAIVRRSDGRSRSGAPSMLLAFGEVCASALERSGLGVCFRDPIVYTPQLSMDEAAA
ncbi:MAG: DNA N-6-adenine-methyltransferase [Solirubrobacterales bacterium]